MTRAALLLTLLLLTTSGCGEEQGGAPGGGPSTDGLAGESRLVDDTGRDDTTDPGGWIVVVPSDRVPELWEEVEQPGELATGAFELDRQTVQALGGTLAAVDAQGRFVLEAEGPSLVCRMPEDGYVRGCVEADLPASGSVVTGWGEAGFGVGVGD